MRYVDVTSLPQITFAHIYRAEAYRNAFAPMSNTAELTYIAEGEVQCEENGQVFTARKGDVLCFLRDRPSRVWTDAPHCHHTVGVKMEWRESGEGANLLQLPLVLSAGAAAAPLCGIIDRIIQHLEDFQVSRAKGGMTILELLCGIDKCAGNSEKAGFSGDAVYAERAKRYILQRLHEPITQREVAAHLGITPGYLCSVFRKAEGMTLMHYLNRTKLTRMKALIENEHIRLSTAAAIYGYSDPNYVSRLYKSLFGRNVTDRF